MAASCRYATVPPFLTFEERNLRSISSNRDNNEHWGLTIINFYSLIKVNMGSEWV
ncbi:hypothetical protein Acife_0618 [Acidithiobacillus ferrivorans SS3]|uniref:Uncharacterized protein n=1 Tax=Acidithiobacillus ferrivorans SS3 TaxID=743299 RepID=G0JKS4_9PROT|nr:hypothetical protein Acife_0618 [Acidithiobacillus ferrivorans SS3]